LEQVEQWAQIVLQLLAVMVAIQFSHQLLQQVVVVQQLAEILVHLAQRFRAVQVRVLEQIHHHLQQVLMELQVKEIKAAIVRESPQEQVAVVQVRLEAMQRQIQLELAATV